MRSLPIGGNPALAASLLLPFSGPADASCRWLASGRDGYLLVARSLGEADWYIPEFICGVVPQTLRAASVPCIPYRPGELRQAWRTGGRRRISVLSWDVADSPHPADQATVADGREYCLEDRCLWAGLPGQAPLPAEKTFMVGSLRKWLGVAEGGWVRAGSALSEPDTDPNAVPAKHVLSQLANSALRRLRGGSGAPGGDTWMEDANVALGVAAEKSLGIPQVPRPISVLGMTLAQAAASGTELQREGRLRTALAVQALAGGSLPQLSAGVLGLRIRCEERDSVLRRLAEAAIYAPVHWRDGNWSGAPGIAGDLAEMTLTLPCPPLTDDNQANYLERLAPILTSFNCKIVSSNRAL